MLSSGRFFFPCTDVLDLPFFNRTNMLGLHPLGFITDACIRFDGADGLCADFFEHDILHGAFFVSGPELFIPARVLADREDTGDYSLFCHVDQKITGHPWDRAEIYGLNIPKEALELLMFEIHHERNDSWEIACPKYNQTMQNSVFEKDEENLRFVYDNLELRYQE